MPAVWRQKQEDLWEYEDNQGYIKSPQKESICLYFYNMFSMGGGGAMLRL